MKSFIYSFFIWLYWSASLVHAVSAPVEFERYKNDISVGEYILVDKKRLNLTLFEYTYKISLTNISGNRLKNVALYLDNRLFRKGFSERVLYFGDFEIGETKQNLNPAIIRFNRDISSLDFNIFPIEIDYFYPFSFTDNKGNKISLFLPKYYDHPILTDFISFSENKNPTNKDLNTFPAITHNFIEISFPDESEFTQNQYLIEVEYIENPHRLLRLRSGETQWSTFSKDTENNLITFEAKPENSSIIFALIRRNP